MDSEEAGATLSQPLRGCHEYQRSNDRNPQLLEVTLGALLYPCDPLCSTANMKKLKPDQAIKNLAEYVALVSDADSKHDRVRWFRGQAAKGHQLVPGAYRKRSKKRKDTRRRLQDEHDNRDQFQLRAAPFLHTGLGEIPHVPKASWDWYFLMQHYGLPTRLLDWSESPLVGLFFALTEGTSGHARKADSAVWVLNPRALNRRSGEDSILLATDAPAPHYLSEEPIVLDDDPQDRHWRRIPVEPIAIQPPFHSRRIAAQLGCFTVHGRDNTPLEDLAKNREPKVPQLLGTGLWRITIPRRRVGHVLDQLKSLGIGRSTVFPELEHLARDIGDD
jgi:hypothetical protein